MMILARLTLTYFIAISNLFPIAFKLISTITAAAKAIILTKYGYPNETITIDK